MRTLHLLGKQSTIELLSLSPHPLVSVIAQPDLELESSCLSFPNARIMVMHHHTWLLFLSLSQIYHHHHQQQQQLYV